MNTKLKTEAKDDFVKDFFELMNNSVFGKTIENVRKHRDLKLITTDERRNQVVTEPNYHTTKRFSKDLLAIEMKNIKVKMNKPLILDISKTLLFKFLYDYIKPKNQNIAKLCYMDTGRFVIYIITEDFYDDIADDVKKRYDT